MVITKAVNLPTKEDLTVEEVNLSTSALRAGAFHLGVACEDVNNEFMLCKHELSDPRKCLNEGKAVTSCALNFFKQIKGECKDEFTQYAKCLNYSSSDMKFSTCRQTQKVYDDCVLDKLEIKRPDYGYFSRIKVHHTEREKPAQEAKTVYADAPYKLSPSYNSADFPPGAPLGPI